MAVSKKMAVSIKPEKHGKMEEAKEMKGMSKAAKAKHMKGREEMMEKPMFKAGKKPTKKGPY